MRIVVIGGGCYGRLHATRLLTAQRRGQLAFDELLVIDRAEETLARAEIGEEPGVRYVKSDWSAFLRTYLATAAAPEDQIIPAPFAPHLLFDWLVEALAIALPERTVQAVPVSHTFDQPYARHGQDGRFYFSFADWECPVSCMEPATCPAIRAPRTWEQSDFLTAYAADHPEIADLAIWRCFHLAGAVSGVAVAELQSARARFLAIAQARPEALTFLAATVSACHGAIGQLAVGPLAPPSAESYHGRVSRNESPSRFPRSRPTPSPTPKPSFR